MKLSDCFDRLVDGKNLSAATMNEAMTAVMGGSESDEDIETFLRLYQKKGVSVDELVAAAAVMRAHAAPVRRTEGLIDTCGTGADSSGTLNLSTLSALTCAAAGLRVAKHGNRAVSGTCGSADLLEALGIAIRLDGEKVLESIRLTGFGFFFAPDFHPATRHAMAARKRIAGKTLFNLLGPLSNPAAPERQLVGLYDPSLLELVASALGRLGLERALVVHGEGGIDEVSIAGPTSAVEWAEGRLRALTLTPESMESPVHPLTSLQCHSREESIAAAREVLDGQPGPRAEAAAANAGIALWVAGAAATPAEGVRKARRLLSSRAVAQKAAEVADCTRRLAATGAA